MVRLIVSALYSTLTLSSIWNWQQSARLSRFSNGNPAGSKINEAQFINEDDQALLMTGSSDGMIKIFRNYESERQVEMVSAFRALTDLVPSNKNSGLVFDWQQGQGKLLVAGDVKVIRVWNAATEICTNVRVPIETSYHVLSFSGYTGSFGIVYYVAHIRPSRWPCLHRWLWRWSDPSLRPTVETCNGNDQGVARTQAVDHQCSHAARGLKGACQWKP